MNRYAAHYLAIRNDFCLNESCWSLVRQGVTNFFFTVPTRFWDGEDVPRSFKGEILDVVNNLKSSSLPLVVRVDFTAPLRRPVGEYAEAEALMRNWSLQWIRTAGKFEHVLVVDTDEFWRPGALELLDKAVEASHPHSATLDALPVIGFPGYPVEGKTEGLLTYVRSTHTFKSGRTPKDSGHTLAVHSDPKVIHFTSTRRTLADTIQKHLKSCHYGDKDYDFDGWLKDKLPKLKPGEKRCHMFKGWDVWPSIRTFTSEEKDAIPVELRKYMGGAR